MLEDENSQESSPEDNLSSAAHTATSAANTAVSNAPRIVRFTGKGVQFAGRGLQAVGTGMQALAPIPVVGWISAGLGKGLAVFGKGVQVAGKGMEKGGQAAGKIKSGLGQAKPLGSVTNLASPSKLGSRIARLIPGPVGLALRIKDLLEKLPLIGKYFKKAFDLGKKIAAGIAALIAYLLLMLAAKIAGLIAGLVFGAVTGLPLLLLGPVGIPLYVGWVAYNGYRGFQDPGAAFGKLNTLGHYATHPWELATKPLGFAKDTISAAGGNIAVGVKGFVSGIGSTVSGAFSTAASAIWGGITSSAGTILGGFGVASNFLISGIGGLSIPTSAITVPLHAGIGGVITSTVFIAGYVLPAALFNLEGEAGLGVPGQNEFFSLTKTSSHSRLSNQSPDQTQQVAFTITLTVKDTKLTGVSVTDEMRKTDTNGVVTSITFDTFDRDGNTLATPDCPTIMARLETCINTIRIGVDSSFNDSVVVNTVTVKATPEGQSEVTDSVTATVIVGEPPLCAPNAVPIREPWRLTSDFGPAHPLGVDITDGTGTSILSTFPCTTTVIHADWLGRTGAGYGFAVILQSGQFKTISGHMDRITVNVGDQIPPYGEIGPLGNTGYSTGPHVHYEVRVDEAVVNPHDYGIPYKPIDQY